MKEAEDRLRKANDEEEILRAEREEEEARGGETVDPVVWVSRLCWATVSAKADRGNALPHFFCWKSSAVYSLQLEIYRALGMELLARDPAPGTEPDASDPIVFPRALIKSKTALTSVELTEKADPAEAFAEVNRLWRLMY